MKMLTRGRLVLGMTLLSAIPTSSFAQAVKAPPAFDWYAELVATDAAKKTVTAKAPMLPHVGKYVGAFTPGQPIVVVWSQFGGAGDVVRYIVPADATTIESGYVVKGQYVAADAKANTFTFVTGAPDTVIRTLSAAAPGTAIKVHAALVGETGRSPIVSVALNEKPKARPAAKVVVSAIDPNDAVVAGSWVLDTSVMNNALKLSCDLTQQGKKLGGKCAGPGPLGELAVTGAVNGKSVTVQFDVSSFGPTLTFQHRGEVDAQGGTIKGTLNVMGSDSAFTMTKKP